MFNFRKQKTTEPSIESAKRELEALLLQKEEIDRKIADAKKSYNALFSSMSIDAIMNSEIDTGLLSIFCSGRALDFSDHGVAKSINAFLLKRYGISSDITGLQHSVVYSGEASKNRFPKISIYLSENSIEPIARLLNDMATCIVSDESLAGETIRIIPKITNLEKGSFFISIQGLNQFTLLNLPKVGPVISMHNCDSGSVAFLQNILRLYREDIEFRF